MMRPGLQSVAELPEEQANQRSKVARRLLGYLRPYTGLLSVVLVMTILAAAAQAAGPFLIGLAIDSAIGQGNGDQLNTLMLILLGAYIGGAVASRFQFRLMGEVGQLTLARLRTEIFTTIQRLSLRFFDRQPAGDLMSRLVNDTDVLNQLFSQGLVLVVGSIFGLAGIIIAMLALDWRLALASFTVIPVMLWLTDYFSKRARRAFRKTRESIGDVSAEIQEDISAVKVAQAFNRTEANQERFERRNAANRDANVSAVAVTSAFTPVVDVLSTIATAIVAGYGGYLALTGQVSVGVVVAFLTYVQQFFRPIQAISAFYTTAQSALAAAERIFGLVDTKPDLVDRTQAREMPPIRGRVVFDHVCFSYGARPKAEEPRTKNQEPRIGKANSVSDLNGTDQSSIVNRQSSIVNPHVVAIDDVSLVAEPGQTVAIVGPTGAGKTTLVNLIGRFYEVSEGAVLIDGVDVREVTRASLRRQMGVVLQDSFLFSGTIAENIRYGKLDATDDEVQAAARAARADEFISRLPDGYATQLGERGGTLSQGQRQLLGIARAILANPRILILDEATSSVDTRTEQLIQEALRTLLKGRTSFVIAHRLSTIRDADQVLVMQAGKVVERGTHDELLARNGAYAELYRRQFRDDVPMAA